MARIPRFSLLALALTAACATRSPATRPLGSAALPSTEESRTERVDVALTEEPPLPGDDLGEWRDLDRAASHSHHGGGHR